MRKEYERPQVLSPRDTSRLLYRAWSGESPAWAWNFFWAQLRCEELGVPMCLRLPIRKEDWKGVYGTTVTRNYTIEQGR